MDDGDVSRVRVKSRRRRPEIRGRAPRASLEAAPEEEEDGEATYLTKKQLKVAVLAFLTTFLAVANRVLYKMALVPLKDFPFFLAQLTTFGYVGVYFLILYIRYRAAIVTPQMLAVPKYRFAATGLLESLGLASGMAASAFIPGALISILTQTYLVWQLVLSYLFLGKRYSKLQLLGCSLVVAGVITTVASGNGTQSAMTANLGLWPILLSVFTIFPAGSSILKEFVFRDAKERLQGGSLDIFVVNSFGSGFQAIFVFLLLPLLSRLKGIEFAKLPAYFQAGAGCLLNIGGQVTGCEGAPLVPLIYVAANLAFNISALSLLKESSGVVTSLLLTLSVPLTIAAFTFPLPLVGNPVALPPSFGVGLAILVAGLVMYNVGGGIQSKDKGS